MYPRTYYGVPRGIAVVVYTGRECSRIEPLGWARIADGHLLAGDQIGPLLTFRDAVIVLAVEAFIDVERAAAGERDDSIQRPAVCQHAQRALAVFGER